jgi:PPM family protein phosphatase
MNTEPKFAAPGGGWRINAAGLTDRGRLRENNEDAFSITPELGLYLVSDGMGGARAGQVASAAAARALPPQLDKLFRQRAPAGLAEMDAVLGEAVALLSDELLDRSSADPALRGAGATVVACWFLDGSAALVHMGDSRAYRLRDGRLECLTIDHTVTALLLQLKQIDEIEALEHPGRHALTRYVGMEPAAQPETAVLEINPGDRYLLCSDGLWGVVEEQKLAELLAEDSDLESICRRMIDAANATGGPDNITVVVIDIGPQPGKEQPNI